MGRGLVNKERDLPSLKRNNNSGMQMREADTVGRLGGFLSPHQWEERSNLFSIPPSPFQTLGGLVVNSYE